VVTVTTVGYGDVVPSTPQSKVLAAFLMLAGVLFLGFFTAKIASIFIHSRIDETQNRAIELLYKKEKKLEEKEKELEKKIRAQK
jgi:voltage-gated potassium channel